jgi:hypothetical protein
MSFTGGFKSEADASRPFLGAIFLAITTNFVISCHVINDRTNATEKFQRSFCMMERSHRSDKDPSVLSIYRIRMDDEIGLSFDADDAKVSASNFITPSFPSAIREKAGVDERVVMLLESRVKEL